MTLRAGAGVPSLCDLEVQRLEVNLSKIMQLRRGGTFLRAQKGTCHCPCLLAPFPLILC